MTTTNFDVVNAIEEMLDTNESVEDMLPCELKVWLELRDYLADVSKNNYTVEVTELTNGQKALINKYEADIKYLTDNLSHWRSEAIRLQDEINRRDDEDESKKVIEASKSFGEKLQEFPTFYISIHGTFDASGEQSDD